MPTSPTSSAQPKKPTAAQLLAPLAVAVTVISIVNGCSQPTSPTPNVHSTSPDLDSLPIPSVPADQFLRNSLTRYRNTSQYSDQGNVQLTATLDGIPQTESAPLRITMDESHFFLQAYDVRILADPHTIYSWLEDPTTDHHDGQVRIQNRVSQGRPTPEELLSDPLIASRLQNGLGGTAPQLDWLLAEEPMQKLFAPENRFRYQKHRLLGKDICVVVQVESNQQTYRFWVDRRSALIRRVELPIPNPSQRTESRSAQTTAMVIESLIIDLAEAQFQIEPNWYRPPQFPDNSKWVTQFVPLPPTEPPNALGNPLPPVQAVSRAGKTILTQHGGADDLTIVLFAGTNESPQTESPKPSAATKSNSTASTLTQWHHSIPKNLRDKIGVVIVATPNAATQLDTHLQTHTRENSPPIAVDRQQNLPDNHTFRDNTIAIVDNTGQVCWIQDGLTPQELPALGALINDVLQNVNIPDKLREQWTENQRTYQRSLQKFRASR